MAIDFREGTEKEESNYIQMSMMMSGAPIKRILSYSPTRDELYAGTEKGKGARKNIEIAIKMIDRSLTVAEQRRARTTVIDLTCH